MDDLLPEFLAETGESIEALDRALVDFERTPAAPALLSEIFRVMHTIKGTCGFLGLQRLAAIAHAAENVLGQFREGALTPNSASVSAILEAVDLIKILLAELAANGAESAGDDSALISRLDAIAEGAPAQQANGHADFAARIGGLSSLDCAVEMGLQRIYAGAYAERFAAIQPDALQACVRDHLWAAASGKSLPPLSAALNDLGVRDEAHIADLLTHLESGLREMGLEAADVAALMNIARAKPAAPAATREAPPVIEAPASQTIRVQVETLERLMNVVSELVLIRNQLLQTLRSQPESPFAAPLQRLNHVTSELQESVMTARMQPIGVAWAKLPRLARDLALELNKRIDLEMLGGETELDRQVLESIRDPLTHMIRNAADHGLETPAERLAAGKPETGVIRLAARHEGSHIVIEMSDDGRGLNIAKLRAKALAQGLLPPNEIETASDAKIQQLIFHAGFSTAETVSAVSGRGVGMDVVRTNIEKIGGAIEMWSAEGRGTRFTIRIPLTLTIVSALIVECGGERFAMPQTSVLELVGANNGGGRSIEHINGAPVLRLRDRILPLVSLRRLMGLQSDSEAAEPNILVTRVGASTFGIMVDHIFDTEEIVVKPTSPLLRDIPYYAGATILGDGAVIMILDPKGIATALGSVTQEQDGDLKRAAAEGAGSTQLLVVRGGPNALMAAPLLLVSRIEELDPQRIEYASGRPVLQYRGRLMPLAALEGATPVHESALGRPVIVFDDETRALGLVVDEIVDIVDATLRQEIKPSTPGVLGSLTVSGQVTSIIDLAHYWRMAAFETASELPPATRKRRALIVDPSPFQRNLIAPLLAMADFEVTTATDASHALALCADGHAFDVILSDAGLHEGARLSEAAAPVVGLYDDQADANAVRNGFTHLASRLDRDGLLAALAAVTSRTAA